MGKKLKIYGFQFNCIVETESTSIPIIQYIYTKLCKRGWGEQNKLQLFPHFNALGVLYKMTNWLICTPTKNNAWVYNNLMSQKDMLLGL